MARPDGNITGVSLDAGLELYGKRIQYLVETAPRLAKVRFLMSPTIALGGGKRRPATRYVTLQAGRHLNRRCIGQHACRSSRI